MFVGKIIYLYDQIINIFQSDRALIIIDFYIFPKLPKNLVANKIYFQKKKIHINYKVHVHFYMYLHKYKFVTYGALFCACGVVHALHIQSSQLHMFASNNIVNWQVAIRPSSHRRRR